MVNEKLFNSLFSIMISASSCVALSDDVPIRHNPNENYTTLTCLEQARRSKAPLDPDAQNVLHLIEQAYGISDEVMLMNEGDGSNIVGSPEYSDFQHLYLKRLIRVKTKYHTGDSEISLIGEHSEAAGAKESPAVLAQKLIDFDQSHCAFSNGLITLPKGFADLFQ